MNSILKIQLVLFFLLFSGINSAFSQSSNEQTIDSLVAVLINLEGESTEKVDVLLQLSKLTEEEDYERALNYAEKGLAQAEKLRYESGIMYANWQVGKVYNNYFRNFFEAEHHITDALQIAEKLKDEAVLIEIYQDYAFLMYSMGNCEQAINYNQKAISIAEKNNDYDGLASLYSYLGDVYMDCGDEDSAVDYFSMTYALFTSNKLKNVAPPVYLASATYLSMTNKYDDAIELIKTAIDVYHNTNQVRFESYAYSQLAKTYIQKGDYYAAQEAIQVATEIANSYRLMKEKLDAYTVQVELYDSLGDYKKTYLTLIKLTKFKDSLSTAQVNEQNLKFQTNYERMVNENELKQLKEEKLNKALEAENERLNRNIIVAFLIFVVVLVILMILRLRYIRRKEREMRVLTLATSHTTNSIIIFNKEIRVEWVNKGFERLTGMTLAQVKGQYFMDFYNGPDLDPQHVQELRANFLSGKAFTMELSSFNRNTNKAYWISVSVTPLYEDNELKSYVSVATDITDLQNASIEVKKAHEQTILLNEIGRQITSTLSVSEIIEKVYENINKIMDAQNLGIGIYQEETHSLHFPEPIEKGKKLNSFDYYLTDEARLAVKCFKENLEINVGSSAENAAITGANPSPVEGEQPESVIYLPLVSKWKTMGVISVQSFRQNAFDQIELDMVRTLATYVAIALENAGLYQNMESIVEERTKEVRAQKEELQKNFNDLKLLSEIGIEIASSLNFEDVFDKVYDTVANMMDAEIFGIRIYHEEQGIIEYKYEIESGQRDPVMSVSMDDKDNYSVWCVEHAKEILINDNKNEYTKYVKEIKVPSGDMPNSLIFYPMIAEERVFGVITVQSFELNAYTNYHMAILKTLSAYTAEALSNAELFNTLEQKVEERTNELAQKNKDIMSSINYAKRIQGGILPTESFMNSLLPESFVLYRPRDVISGDFYWVERAMGKVFFAVVDCTGHGVPGALMSIIGKNILDQAVNEKEITDPDMILTYLRAGLRVAFSSGEAEEGSEIEDGMDLGVCVWDVHTNMVTFSGANSNLYLVHDGALEVIKGEKQGVSASDFDIKNYASHTFEIMKGDTIYLSSDGYPDQFGGERMKKYSQRRFQELVMRLSGLPIDQQSVAFNVELEEWMGENAQLDDICVMGVKF